MATESGGSSHRVGFFILRVKFARFREWGKSPLILYAGAGGRRGRGRPPDQNPRWPNIRGSGGVFGRRDSHRAALKGAVYSLTSALRSAKFRFIAAPRPYLDGPPVSRRISPRRLLLERVVSPRIRP